MDVSPAPATGGARAASQDQSFSIEGLERGSTPPMEKLPADQTRESAKDANKPSSNQEEVFTVQELDPEITSTF